MKLITNLELGWVVGLLEGEGCFLGHSEAKPKKMSSTKVVLRMCDKDVVQKFASLFGLNATTTYISKKNPKWRDVHEVRITGRKAHLLLLLIVNHMGERRKKRIEEILSIYPKLIK